MQTIHVFSLISESWKIHRLLEIYSIKTFLSYISRSTAMSVIVHPWPNYWSALYINNQVWIKMITNIHCRQWRLQIPVVFIELFALPFTSTATNSCICFQSPTVNIDVGKDKNVYLYRFYLIRCIHGEGNQLVIQHIYRRQVIKNLTKWNKILHE